MFEGFYFLRTAFLLKVVERMLLSPCALNKSQDPVKAFSVFYEICKKKKKCIHMSENDRTNASTQRRGLDLSKLQH